MPPEGFNISNLYQLLGFLIVAGLQGYMRWEMAQVAKKQDKILAQHDANRAELLRMAERLSEQLETKEDVRFGDAIEIVESALRVSYYQGQADAGSDRGYPAQRAVEGARKLVAICMRAKPGHDSGSHPAQPPAQS
jgi:hypothetical protein